MIFSFLNMNELFISKSFVYWKVISENKGRRTRISDIQKYLKTKFPWLQTIFLVKTPKKYAYQIPLYFRICCWNNDKVTLPVYESHLHTGQNWLCQPQIYYTTPHFLSNHNFDCHPDFAIFLNNGGRTWTTRWFWHNSHIFISISISCVCGKIMCATFAKCQCWHTIYWDDWGTKSKNKHLQEDLAEFNHVQYRSLPANASRGKNVLRGLKKVSLTPMDQINQ